MELHNPFSQSGRGFTRRPNSRCSRERKVVDVGDEPADAEEGKSRKRRRPDKEKATLYLKVGWLLFKVFTLVRDNTDWF